MNLQLIDILRYTRQHESKTEALFINNYLLPKLNAMGLEPTMDLEGNIWASNSPKAVSPYLFVAHIDTCHREEGMCEPLVKDGIISVSPDDISKHCLGADDGVGIYANLRMIEAGVLGTYLFTRGEECGGIGASFIAKHTPEMLDGFLMSVEVDRAGTDEVICSQSYGECASETFSNMLGLAIGMGHKASHEGVYTDVSEFASIIPENVNLSAGYKWQHGPREYVDVDYVEKLILRLIAVDWSLLGIDRVPGDYGTQDSWYEGYASFDTEYEDLCDYVIDNPSKVANFLDSLGVDKYEIEKEWGDTEMDIEPLAVGMS